MAHSSETLVTLLRRSLVEMPRTALAERVDGEWSLLSASEMLERVEAVALAIRSRGIERGSRIGLMANNCVDWIVTNFGILSSGCVTVPIYPTQAADQVEMILADSDAKLLFIDHPVVAERLQAANITLPPHVAFADPLGLPALEAHGMALRSADPGRAAVLAAEIAPSDLAVLIYTSGTTGRPKGVMLSHFNIASNAIDSFDTVADIILIGSPVLSMLPYAHIYEHTNIFGFFSLGATVYVTHTPEELLDDLRSVQPICTFAVPRIFERVLIGIKATAKKAGGVRAKLVPWALNVGRDYMRAKYGRGGKGSLLSLQYALAHALVLKKLRPMLGLDRLVFFGSGSAPLHEDIAYTFAAADISILEGYGLSEAAPVVTCNDPHDPHIGTVGKAIPGVELKLGNDGELLVRGPNVMQGYYHDPESTRTTIVDGWLHTGDIATIDAEGVVKITDRKKELFKTSGGKYIAPARVESALRRSAFVNQVLVLGAGHAHPAALVSPNWPALKAELGLDADAPTADCAMMPSVHDFLTREMIAQTADLASFEQIRWIGVLPRDLTVEDGELSPTLKVKRRVVEERYAALIETTFAAGAQR